MRMELERKEALIARHHERLVAWSNCVAKKPPYPGHQQQQQQVAGNQAMNGVPGAQSSTSQQAGASGSTQGPLAYLEQTTSNIGSEARKG